MTNVNYETWEDYQLPCVTTKNEKELHIGVWANRHRQYLKQHHRIIYYNLLTSEKLYIASFIKLALNTPR